MHRTHAKTIPSRPVSEVQLEALVDRSFASSTPLDQLVSEALYPEGAPRMWGEWSPEARACWDRAMQLWLIARDIRRAEVDRPQRTYGKELVSVAEAWAAILLSCREAEPEQRLTWADLASRLGLRTRRQCGYILTDKLGFVLVGKPGQKEVLCAPCIYCKAQFNPACSTEYSCPTCTKGSVRQYGLPLAV